MTQDPQAIGELLEGLGIDFAQLGCGDSPTEARVVVINAGLEEARKALGATARDQVIMARVDSETARDLDQWVDAGLAKSRSEAAALFIREGLSLRSGELARLGDAIAQLAQARQRLQQEARDILGEREPGA